MLRPWHRGLGYTLITASAPHDAACMEKVWFRVSEMKGVQLSLLVSAGLGEIKLGLATRLPHIESEKNSKRVTTRWPGGGPGGGGAKVQSNLTELLPRYVIWFLGRQTPFGNPLGSVGPG